MLEQKLKELRIENRQVSYLTLQRIPYLAMPCQLSGWKYLPLDFCIVSVIFGRRQHYIAPAFRIQW
jgi:hypothetical protein